jgi:hypothetical protein
LSFRWIGKGFVFQPFHFGKAKTSRAVRPEQLKKWTDEFSEQSFESLIVVLPGNVFAHHGPPWRL